MRKKKRPIIRTRIPIPMLSFAFMVFSPFAACASVYVPEGTREVALLSRSCSPSQSSRRNTIHGEVRRATRQELREKLRQQAMRRTAKRPVPALVGLPLFPVKRSFHLRESETDNEVP